MDKILPGTAASTSKQVAPSPKRRHRRFRTHAISTTPKPSTLEDLVASIEKTRIDESQINELWLKVHEGLETFRKLYDTQILVDHQRSSFKDTELILSKLEFPKDQVSSLNVERMKARRDVIKERLRQTELEQGEMTIAQPQRCSREGSVEKTDSGSDVWDLPSLEVCLATASMVEPAPFVFSFTWKKRILSRLERIRSDMAELLPDTAVVESTMSSIRFAVGELSQKGALLGKLSNLKLTGERPAFIASLGSHGALYATEGGINLISSGIAKLSFDDDYIRVRKKKFATIEGIRGGKGSHDSTVHCTVYTANVRFVGLKGGAEALGRGLWGGVSGIVLQPIRGARERGVEGENEPYSCATIPCLRWLAVVLFTVVNCYSSAGFFRGMGLGLMGAMVKPISGVIDMATFTTEGLRTGAVIRRADVPTQLRDDILMMLEERGRRELDVDHRKNEALELREDVTIPKRRLSV